MYKAILTLMTRESTLQPAVSAAVELARVFDAHLTGLYVHEPPYSRQDFAAAYASSGALLMDLDKEADTASQAAGDLHKAFLETARQAGVRKFDWRYAQGSLGSVLTALARGADLLVMSSPDAGDYASAAGVPTAVTIASGCPILLVPAEAQCRLPPRHAVIAWNASREASRAVREALPLLRRAEQVDLLAINASGTAHRRQMDADLQAQLAHHGIDANLHHLDAGTAGVAGTLLSYAQDVGADLICMGAYGHSRLRELVLGGVTRDLMRQPPGLPLFLAH